MSCLCVICKSYGRNSNHSGFVRTLFTAENPIGLLTIKQVNYRNSEACGIFKLNKHMSIIVEGQELILPTFTIEDVLSIEVCTKDMLNLLGKCAVKIAQVEMMKTLDVAIESEFDSGMSISFTLEYTPRNSENPTGYLIYRKNNSEVKGVIYLRVKTETQESSVKISDKGHAVSNDVWSPVMALDSFSSLKVTVSQTVSTETGITQTKETSSNIQGKQLKSPPFPLTMAAPICSSFLEFYLIPISNIHQRTPEGTLQVTFPSEKNLFLVEYIKEFGELELSLKSTYKNPQENTFLKNIEELTEELESSSCSYQFITFKPQDKLIVKVFIYPEGKGSAPDLAAVSVAQLRELPGLTTESHTLSLQLGSDSLQLELRFTPSPTQQNYRKPSETNEIGVFEEAKTEELTYKDMVFYDVLDLLSYKTNRIAKKELLQKTENHRLLTKHNSLLKTLNELELADSIVEFDSIVKRSQLKSKSKPELPTQPKLGHSLCACGNPSPKFKGYCGNCVKSLKTQYEQLLEWYLPIQQEYDRLEKQLISMNTKKYLMIKKIEKLEKRIVQPSEVLSELDEKQEITNVKLAISQMQAEIQSLELDSQMKEQQFKAQEGVLLANMRELTGENDILNMDLSSVDEDLQREEAASSASEERLVFMTKFNQKHSNAFSLLSG